MTAFVRAGGARTVLHVMARHPHDLALQEAGCSLLTSAVLAEPAAHAHATHAQFLRAETASVGDSSGGPGGAHGGPGLAERMRAASRPSASLPPSNSPMLLPLPALQAALQHIGREPFLRDNDRLQLQAG